MAGGVADNRGMTSAFTPEIAALENAPAQGAPALKERGTALFQRGFPERALAAFDSVLAKDPSDLQALVARISLLISLERPRAAWRMACEHRAALDTIAPGCNAFAAAALAVEEKDEARAAYGRGIALDPSNARALAGLAHLEARAGEHESALRRLQACLRIAPEQPDHWANLVDCLVMCRRVGDAANLLQQALARFPANMAFAVRVPLLKSYLGDFDGASKDFARLPEKSYGLLAQILKVASPASAAALRADRSKLPRPRELFTHHVFDGMRQADWRQEATLTQVLRELLAQARKYGGEPDWRDAQFYTLLLPLTETEQLHIRDTTAATVRERVARFPLPDTGVPPPRTDGRMHIGISTPSLLDARTAHGLREELRLHDRSRFAFHLYSPVHSKDDAVHGFFEGLAEVVEIGHLTADEAVLRMRLDRLDLWLDLTYFTPTCRIEIPAYRVAPVMVRRQNWQRTHRPPCDYSMGDTVTHPGPLDSLDNGAIARMPSTCWIGIEWESADPAAATRVETGLPEQALVLCAFVPSVVTIDSLSFGTWMRILRALPHAVLWLQQVEDAARANLEREAASAGIDPARLVFAPKLKRTELLARLPLADLYLDTLRFSSPQMVATLLRAGIPALAVAGHNMASRLGASVVTAAGLPECVLPDAAAYEAEAIRLGKDPAALAALRAKLRANHATAPLFDMAGRVREWENAWVTMIERQRAGLPPQAFDVTPARP